jgi:hypothetical protein
MKHCWPAVKRGMEEEITMNQKQRKKTVALSALVLVSLVFLASYGCGKPSFSTDYQAVFMDNGQVFFGRLQNGGGDYPLLKEVYYIGRQAAQPAQASKENQAPPEVKNILIKRGNEWHGPDYMYINKQHIVVIEPVSPKSRVATLIAEARNQKPQPSQQ